MHGPLRKGDNYIVVLKEQGGILYLDSHDLYCGGEVSLINTSSEYGGADLKGTFLNSIEEYPDLFSEEVRIVSAQDYEFSLVSISVIIYFLLLITSLIIGVIILRVNKSKS